MANPGASHLSEPPDTRRYLGHVIQTTTRTSRLQANIMPANYDETLIPDYVLPDPLVDGAGQRVTDATTWRHHRRPEILRLFEQHVYGAMPGPPSQTTAEILEEGEALGGRAIRRQVRLHFHGNGYSTHADILLFLPRSQQPVAAFVGLSFFGNHAVCDDPAVELSETWMRKSDKEGIVDHRATQASRGMNASRWSIERIIERGYALATAYCGDFDPDFDDGYANGVHPLFYRPGQEQPAPGEWGTISAWTWGLRRILDYLETDADVDAKRVAVMGHSRLGKTALWAGAIDERFGLVISNDSGCGGAALSRRCVGETVGRINTSFPHWFCDNYRAYNDAEGECPVDQHELIALVAPRPVYVASATEDLWADPAGELLAAFHAGPVYDLLGRKSLTVSQLPAGGTVMNDTDVSYHLRVGGHDVTDWDWQQWLDAADRHLATSP